MNQKLHSSNNTTRKPLLKVTDLSIGYSTKFKTKVLAKALNFELYSGELVAVVGTNGIGKSTLLRTLTGYQKPVQGQIVIASKPIADYKPLEMAKKVSVVLTEVLATKNFTVQELVALGRQPYTNWLDKLRQEDLEHIEIVLQQTGLQTLKKEQCYKLSDGQLQRVLIARALVQDTATIVLDEPTSYLDFNYKVALLQLLRTITIDNDKLVLFASHDIELALQLCHRIIVMKPKEVVVDTPDSLVANGCFDDLFGKDEGVVFDRSERRFVCK